MSQPQVAPLILRPPYQAVEETFREWGIVESVDQVEEQAAELFQIHKLASAGRDGAGDMPAFLQDHFGGPLETVGNWVLFPWAKKAVRVLDEDDFFTLRTNRNQNLITREEQHKYASAVIAIAGLSVGSNIAVSVALTGGGNHLRIADRDTLALTNLNRVSSGVPSLGLNKVVACARRLYEINPYASVETYCEGLTEDNIDEFFQPPVAVVFDEIDDVRMKILLRLKAREAGLPVVSIADTGDNILVDIERFDQGVTALYHGRLSDGEAKGFLQVKNPSRLELLGMIIKILGVESAVPRMQDSLLEVGRTLVSWPQLGTAATLAGSAGAYIARRIVLGQPVRQGRIHVSLDSALVPDYDSPEQVEMRRKHTQEIVEFLAAAGR